MASFSRTCRATLARLYQLGTPAATVCLLRNAPTGSIECLLLQKSHKQRFGGLHVFPGGAVDAADKVHSAEGELDVVATVINAATRELQEETSVHLDVQTLALLSHWLPPGFDVKKRGKNFSTFFVAGALSEHASLKVDGAEIVRHQWLTPERALALHAAGEMPMLPPTLHTLGAVRSASSAAGSAEEAVRALTRDEPRTFQFANLSTGIRSLVPHALPAFLRWLFVVWRKERQY